MLVLYLYPNSYYVRLLLKNYAGIATNKQWYIVNHVFWSDIVILIAVVIYNDLVIVIVIVIVLHWLL